jgi:adenylate cyclase
MSFFRELKRRNVFRVAAAYSIGAWLLIEVSSTLEETLHLPDWSDSLLAMFLLLFFPVALFLSWAFEITPEGIRRESVVEAETDSASRALTARRLDWAVITMVAIALVLMGLDRLLPGDGPATAAAPQPTVEPTSELTGSAPDAPAPTAIEPLSIAVLPFVNMSSDSEQEYFSDGLTEELLNLLAGIDELKVAARTSSFFYKDKVDQVPLLEIARQLEVAHVLEGSVRRSGDRIRITAQLIQAKDGFHLWSQTWDRTLDDIFTIQDEIAAAVVGELKVTLLGDTPHARVVDPRSFELAMRGRFLFNRRNRGDLEQAFALFQEAIAIDPGNAVAWVGIAPLHVWLKDPPDWESARHASQTAVELDPENAAAHWRLAQTLWNLGQQDRAIKEFDLSRELGQKDPLVLSGVSGMFLHVGDPDRGIDYQERAVAADPLNLVNVGNLAAYLTELGRVTEAEAVAEKMLELAPGSGNTTSAFGFIRLLQGRLDEALELAERLPDGENAIRLMAMVQHSLGNRAASDRATARFAERYAESAPIDLACIYAWRGDSARALDLLEAQAQRNLDELPLVILESPYLANLNGEPRWAAVKQALLDRPLPDWFTQSRSFK